MCLLGLTDYESLINKDQLRYASRVDSIGTRVRSAGQCCSATLTQVVSNWNLEVASADLAKDLPRVLCDAYCVCKVRYSARNLCSRASHFVNVSSYGPLSVL